MPAPLSPSVEPVEFPANTDVPAADVPANDVPVARARVAARPRSVWRRRLHNSAVVSVFLFVGLAALIAGLELRRWTYVNTATMRFVPDIRRNYEYGSQSLDEGLLNVYENAERSKDDYLDYVPLRLATFAVWVRHLRASGIAPDAWGPAYEVTAPLLRVNVVAELLSAAAAFALVRRWGGGGPDAPPRRFRNWGRASLAALLVWFNVGALPDGYGWPTWDVWVPPFFLWAAYLASVGWWGWSGVVLGIGACFKGQQLLVTPVFVLWPLVAGRPAAAVRWAAGLAGAIGLVAAPWMLTYKAEPAVAASPRVIDWAALAWVAGVLLAGTMAAIAARRWAALRERRAWLPWVVAATALVLAAWPVVLPRNHGHAAAVVGAAVAFVALCAAAGRWAAGRPLVPSALAVGGAAAVVGCAALFHANLAWVRVGFLHGAKKHTGVALGRQANFPSVLQQRYGWERVHEIVTVRAQTIGDWPAEDWEVGTIKAVLGTLFAVSLVPCAVALGLQWRRRSPRFLVAVALPWLMFYLWPTQVISRYSLFAATAAAVMVGFDVGFAAVAVFLAVLTAAHTLEMITSTGWSTWSRQPWGEWVRWFRNDVFANVIPDLAWAVIALAFVMLWVALTRDRDPMKEAAR
ncbi:MAG TPA: hypothetical protein VK324_00600 [Tepidisphaeraceae bacterium]|nr:hypothetical protein [Tepidisphaeraceae bacterium]